MYQKGPFVIHGKRVCTYKEQGNSTYKYLIPRYFKLCATKQNTYPPNTSAKSYFRDYLGLGLP
jgi:hypothetical protein